MFHCIGQVTCTAKQFHAEKTRFSKLWFHTIRITSVFNFQRLKFPFFHLCLISHSMTINVIDVLFEDEPCNSPALHTHVCGDMPLLVCMSPG